jgi:hypothetical protein
MRRPEDQDEDAPPPRCPCPCEHGVRDITAIAAPIPFDFAPSSSESFSTDEICITREVSHIIDGLRGPVSLPFASGRDILRALHILRC